MKGLTSSHADQLLKEYGLNILSEQKKKNILIKFIEQFNNFLTILLLIAAICSFVIGEPIDGGLIFTIVILNGLFGLYQEAKAEESIAALKKITLTKVRVIRDGKEQEIDSKFLVPGDVVFIEEGTKISADGVVVEAINLEVNEAVLTGESLPVVKKQDSSTQFLSHESLTSPSAGPLESEKIALDSSTNNETMKQFNNIFDYIDGLSSHSYPNPGFSGSPYDYGRKSIHAYQWELEILKLMGVKKDLPVFITETGWPRNVISDTLASSYYKQAFEQVWNDKGIAAVTPFLLKAGGGAFTEFSFLNADGKPNEIYKSIEAIAKQKGAPQLATPVSEKKIFVTHTHYKEYIAKQEPPKRPKAKFYASILYWFAGL